MIALIFGIESPIAYHVVNLVLYLLVCVTAFVFLKLFFYQPNLLKTQPENNSILFSTWKLVNNEMNVIETIGQIVFIPNGVFPKTILPNDQIWNPH